jgi:prepilin-type N-terminal cleavage/methylation domain-containing protein
MRRAFTFIEIVVVVVIVGILTAIVISSFKEDNIELAKEEMILRLRYAQHLAVMEDKFNTEQGFWDRRRWRFHCSDATRSCAVLAPSQLTPAGVVINPPIPSDFALDPQDRTLLTGDCMGAVGCSDLNTTQRLALGSKWGISRIEKSNNCRGAAGVLTIIFDEIGRPYGLNGDTPELLNATCRITITHSQEGQESFCVEPETGFVRDNC